MATPTRHRPRALLPAPVDALTALVLYAVGVTLAVGNVRYTEALVDEYTGPALWKIVVSMFVVVAPVAFRRVFPLGSLLAVSVGLVFMNVYGVVEFTAGNIAAFLVLVSAGIQGRPPRRDWARGLFALAIAVTFVAAYLFASGLTLPSVSKPLAAAVALAQLAANVVFVGVGWYLGDVERRRREQSAQLEDRNRELRAALDRIDRQAANEERLSIAREVHDIVGHSVSLIGIQAAAARRKLGQDPEAAISLLESIEQRSREGVSELRGLIAVLRDPDSTAPSAAPVPSVEAIGDLIQQVRDAGMTVDFRTVGRLEAGPGLGLSIYRVIQEALSNAIRHGDGSADVVVIGEHDAITVMVSNAVAADHERPRTANRWRTGSGLIGMRERAALHGGTLTYGRESDGLFTIRAVLPIPAMANATTDAGPGVRPQSRPTCRTCCQSWGCETGCRPLSMCTTMDLPTARSSRRGRFHRLARSAALMAVTVTVTMAVAGCSEGGPVTVATSSTAVGAGGDLGADTFGDGVYCDDTTRRAAIVFGAKPGETIRFTSRQPVEVPDGVADDQGTYQLTWRCRPDEAALTWELTAVGVESNRSVSVAIRGSYQEPPSRTMEFTPGEELVCDGAIRVIGQLAGAEPGEVVELSTDDDVTLRNRRAGTDGELDISWSCQPEQADRTWTIEAVGRDSGRVAGFTLTGRRPNPPDGGPILVEAVQEPVTCDRARRVVAVLSNLTPGIVVEFTATPGDGELEPGRAGPDGTLEVHWQCDRTRADTVWTVDAVEATADSDTDSVRSISFIITGSATEDPTAIDIVEEPFVCDGASRRFAVLSNFLPGEYVDFDSPQATAIGQGQADGDGSLPVRWQCTPDQAGTRWEITATGQTSGYTIEFTVTGVT